jgi:hypothetical protein
MNGSTDGTTMPSDRPLVFPKARAAVGLILFLGWLGFLAYLALDRIEPVILARPQILTANLLILAEVADADGRPAPQVKVQKVLAAEKSDWRQLAGAALEIDDLPFHSARQGWQGAGTYLLPITRKQVEKLTIDQITPLPIVPGYFPSASEVTLSVGKQPAAMAKLFSELTGVSQRRLEEMFAQPVVVVSNVPVRSPQESRDLRERIEAAGGTLARLEPAESRIYRATDDVLSQLRQVRPDAAP